MLRLTRGLAGFGAMLVVWACSGDPTNNEGIPTDIVASPEAMLITQGASEAVIVTAVDEDGQSLTADFTVSNVGAGITATVDPNYLATVGSKPIQRQGRIVVTAVGVTFTTFTVNALGLTKDIRVRTTLPGSLAATISNLAPALGEQITITMPPGTFLTSTSLVTFGVLTPIVISTAPDGTSITLIPPPNVNAPASISDVGTVSTPSLTFDITTTDVLVTPAVTTIPSTVSSTTPAGGAAVTLTSTDAGLTFSDGAVVVVGLDTAITTSVAAGGQSMTFVPTPGSTGALTVVRVLVGGFDFGLSLPSTAPAVTAGATVTPIAGTGSTATAPTLQLPAAGTSRGFVDAVTAGYAGCATNPALGVPCQIYRLVLPAAQTVNLSATWEGTSDVGIYILASDGVTVAGTGACDAHGSGAAAKPETCSQPLAAGTYFVAVVPFGPLPLPLWIQVKVATPVATP